MYTLCNFAGRVALQVVLFAVAASWLGTSAAVAQSWDDDPFYELSEATAEAAYEAYQQGGTPPAPRGPIIGWGSRVFAPPAQLRNLVAVAAGADHSLGLRADGSIVAWGRNDYGQCNVPEPNRDFIAVAAGQDHSLGLKADGSIVAWGRNDYGQCYVPYPNRNFIAIAAGGYHSLGLKADGSIVAWGGTTTANATFQRLTKALSPWRPVLSTPSG